MSDFGSLISPKELVDTNIKLGRKTFAVTDTINVQAFPEIQKYVDELNSNLSEKEEKIKPIYGVTLPTQQDSIDLVKGQTNLD